MAGNPDGLGVLAKYSNLPVDRIRYVPNADNQTIRSIRRGVLFLMAFWSGPSVAAFSKLTEMLSRIGMEGLELVVVDVDGSQELETVPEFKEMIRGAGETAWVRDGEIVSTSGLGLNPTCFQPNTLALLALP